MDAYRPPDAALADPEGPVPSGRFRWRPVLLGGFVVDYLGSILAGVVLGVGFTLFEVARGAAPNEAAQQLQNAPGFLWLIRGIGVSLTFLGGYVAARRAGTRFLLHACAAGAIPLVLVAVRRLLLPSVASAPMWITSLSYVVQVPVAAAGGWLAARRSTRRSAST